MVQLDCQDEIISTKPKKHVRIHEDSFDDLDIFSRSTITPADSTFSATTNAIDSSESELSSNSARVLMESSQDSCVDSKHNPTQLFLRLNFRLWDLAIDSLKQKPDEARIWIETKDCSSKLISKNLPLHVACQQRSQPTRGLFEALLSAYPDAAKCPDLSGDLPIHIVCNNESLLKFDGKFFIALLVQAYPTSLNIPNGNGMKPLHILESLKTGKIKSSIKFVKERTSQLIFERGNSSVGDHAHSPRPFPRQSSTPRSSRGNTSSPIRPFQVEEGEQGFASQLNQLRMAEMESPRMRREVSLEAPSYPLTPSPRSIYHSNPIFESTDDDRLDISSTHVAHDVDHGEREPQDQLHCASSSGSEENDGCQKEVISAADQGSLRELTITLAKCSKENALLRKKTSKLTQENVSFRSECKNLGVLVKDLRGSVEREREFCKSQVKELEMKFASTRDKLSETEQRLQAKTKTEQALAQRIGQLESNISGRRAENSTIKAALDEESAKKAILQEDLQMKSEEIEILTFKDSQTRRDMEDIVSRYKDIAKELKTMKAEDDAHRTKIKELQISLDEREIQLRAITEAKGMSDKRSSKAEQAYEVLAINCTEMKEFLAKKSKSYDSHVQKLDKTIADLVHDRDALLAEKGNVINNLEIAKTSISELSKKTLTLEQKLSEAEKRNIILAATTKERDRLQEENEALLTQVVQLEKRASEALSTAEKSAHEIAMLQDAANSLRSDIATEEHARAKIDELKTEVEHTLDAQIHECEAKSSLIAVLQSTITAYKSEIQRLISDQASGERNYTDASARLNELEMRLGSSEHTRSELEKQVEKSRLQTKQIAEVTALFQTKVADQAQTIASLSKENKIIIEKHENLQECCKQLKVLIEQRKQTEDDQRNEVAEIRGLNRMQCDVIKDLEGVICDLRSKISAYKQENNDLSDRMTDVTTASRMEVKQFETVIQTLQHEVAASEVAFQAEIAKLKCVIQKLGEEAAISKETIDALENANRALEEENVSFRQQERLNAQSSKLDDCLTIELAYINCENLIRINELYEKVEIVSARQLDTDGELELMQSAMNSKMESLANSLQEALERNENLQNDLKEAHEKVMSLSERQRMTEAEMESMQLMESDKIELLSASHQKAKERIVVLQTDLENAQMKVKMHVTQQTEIESRAESIQHLNDELRKLLVEREEEAKKKEVALKKSYEKRLLDANAKLLKLQDQLIDKEKEAARFADEKLAMSSTIQKSLEQIVALQRDAKETNQGVESLIIQKRAIEDQLASTQTMNAELQKEDCLANFANSEALVKNTVVLEQRIAALTIKYRSLLEEADRLRTTITEQSEKIERLEDILGRHENEWKSFESQEGLDDLIEIAMIAAQYTSAQPSSDPAPSPDMERSRARDHLVLTIKEVLDDQQSQIKSLKEQHFVTMGKVDDYHRERDKLNAVIKTLRLEKNILITAGKESQQKLYEENKALRESIGDLTKQTKDHQLKIMQLAAKQAVLKRKKADALDLGLADVLNQHTPVSGKDDETWGAQTPDMGSVEVVLVEESRDEQLVSK